MSQCEVSNNEPIWAPSPQRIESSNLQQFINHVEIQGHNINHYRDLHQWSVKQKKDFWLEIWQFCDVIGFKGDCIHGEGLARWGEFQPSRDTIWFPQAQLNYAENLLAQAFQAPDDIAIWFKNERGESQKTTWQETVRSSVDFTAMAHSQWCWPRRCGCGLPAAHDGNGYRYVGNHQPWGDMDLYLTRFWRRKCDRTFWSSAAQGSVLLQRLSVQR